MNKYNFLSLLILFYFAGHAQDAPITYGKTLTIQSEILGEERPIWVYTPEFHEFGADKLPVLYLLDGASHFGHVTAMVDYLSVAMRIPQFIVVGIPNTDRIRDFTPLHSLTGLDGKVDRALFMTSGGGDQFLAFLKEELIPYIDDHYRTQPFRILEGHSLGGQFATYAMHQAPDLFQAMVIISAGFYGANMNTLGGFSEYLHQSKPTTRMYITVGAEPRIEPGVDSLVSILSNADHHFDWTFKQYPKENHLSVTHRSMLEGLLHFYEGWYLEMDNPADLPTYEEIHRHFEALSEKFGYDLSPPEQFLASLGFTHMELKNYGQAVDVFKRYTEDYPGSSGAYFCLGYAQVENDQVDQAIQSFKRSVELNPNNEGSQSFLEELRE